MTLPIPKPPGEPNSTQKIKSSWVNNLWANTYVGPTGTIFFDTYDGVLRLGDNVTPGGQILNFGGSGGNGVPAAPDTAIQFNANGVFGGNIAFSYDVANANVNVIGNVIVANVGHVLQGSGIMLNANVVDTSYTVEVGYNGLSAGKITITDASTIIVPDGGSWTVV